MTGYSHLPPRMTFTGYNQVSTTTPTNIVLQPKNYTFYRNGNLANLFSYVCNNKKFKELFTPT